MATRGGSPAQKPAERELVITRVFDAPRDLVFKAWTDPEHLMRWWAPKGFTTPFCKVDLRPGGVFHYCMRSPEGRDIWGIGVYREIVEPERIVYTDTFADAEGNPVPPAHYGMSSGHPPETLVTVTFAENEGKTKLTLRHSILESVEEREGTQQGWTEMLDRLAEDLAKTNQRRVQMPYVDGYVLPVPKKNVEAYRRIAQKAGRIWREHGALEYRECVGDDLSVKMGTPFPRMTKLKPDETVIFSWAVFKSRAHRDRVNAKVMKDPRLANMMDPKSMPFNVKRMAYGGFKILVDA